MKDFVLDRSSVSIGSFKDEPDDLAYWLKQSPEDRIAGIELLRRQFFSYEEARPEFRRFLEIAQRQFVAEQTGGRPAERSRRYRRAHPIR